MQEKTGRVELGVTKAENGSPCDSVRPDGEPAAGKPESDGDLDVLAKAAATLNP